MTHSPIRSVRAIAAAVLLTVVGCKKENAAPSGNQFASLLFDASSPAAREALATPIDFRLTESNYAQWERAQQFLDAVPRSDFASAAAGNGNAIDRAVATLEASPRARTAIERTGLSVRDFVLETIALAQAAEAVTGKASGDVRVPAENVQFVQRYQSRIMQPRTVVRSMPRPVLTYDEADTTSIGVQSATDVAPTAGQSAAAAIPDSASMGERTRASDSIRRLRPSPEPARPPVDSARDTIPR